MISIITICLHFVVGFWGLLKKFRLVDGLLIYFSSCRYLIWGVHDLVLYNQKEDEANNHNDITMTSQ